MGRKTLIIKFMATTTYFERTIKCQGGEEEMEVELGRSSYFEEDSIYLKVGEKGLAMDRAAAKEFVEAVVSIGTDHGLID